MAKEPKPLGRILLAQQKVKMAVEYGATITDEDLKEIDFALGQLVTLRNAMNSAATLSLPVADALIEHVDDATVTKVAGWIADGQG